MGRSYTKTPKIIRKKKLTFEISHGGALNRKTTLDRIKGNTVSSLTASILIKITFELSEAVSFSIAWARGKSSERWILLFPAPWDVCFHVVFRAVFLMTRLTDESHTLISFGPSGTAMINVLQKCKVSSLQDIYPYCNPLH